METEFERTVNVSPSYNWIRAEPSKNYGVTTCGMWFMLKGQKGAVQFHIGTVWASLPVRQHLSQFKNDYDDPRVPSGYDLGYHSKEPMYEGHSAMKSDCELTGGECYYDGSGLAANRVVEGFLAGGTDWLWKKLEQYYNHRFYDAEYPDFTPEYLPHPDDRKEAA